MEKNELEILVWMDFVQVSNHTIYEYYGCYHHGHCGENKDPKKWEKTKQREKELQSLGYNLETITSCKWKKNPVFPVS